MSNTTAYMMLDADLVDLRKKVARAMPAMRANQVEGSTTRGQHWSPYLKERKVIIFVKRNSLILNLVTHCLKIQTS